MENDELNDVYRYSSEDADTSAGFVYINSENTYEIRIVLVILGL